jgi:hypothetical protein
MTGVVGPSGQRVYLEAARLGGRWVTTPAAIRRFVAAQTPAHGDASKPTTDTTPTPRTPSKRRKASERAAEELERVGI